MDHFQKLLLQNKRFYCVKIINKHNSGVKFVKFTISIPDLTKIKSFVKTKSVAFITKCNTFQ
ncbi:hypothetical protein EM308_08095 [Flavobacterium gilvum]|uniref:Uncharacterized protein n=1 Tax=Flavobacterium gilvum TaxID=1492737 RepID=A0AAC9N6V7_9FLAO|nr:hypothetical protein EM308_08095 [Flavobacterium gilvum]KFC58381.1 hypothetical protein FEM08_28060 [Flavobacterium gilvum]